MELFKKVLYFCGSVLVLASVSLCQTGLSGAEEEDILLRHNNFRSSVSPSAANMERMVWNDELAQFAQTYAEACIDGPNPNRNTASFSGIGENRGFSTRADVNYGAILQQFFNERTDYDFNTPSCISADHTCEEYRQLVWATSSNLGCGAFRCASLSIPNEFPQTDALFLVCNYAPGADLSSIIIQPYLMGQACTQCPNDPPGCEDDLCSAAMSVLTTIPPTTMTATTIPATTMAVTSNPPTTDPPTTAPPTTFPPTTLPPTTAPPTTFPPTTFPPTTVPPTTFPPTTFPPTTFPPTTVPPTTAPPTTFPPTTNPITTNPATTNPLTTASMATTNPPTTVSTTTTSPPRPPRRPCARKTGFARIVCLRTYFWRRYIKLLLRFRGRR